MATHRHLRHRQLIAKRKIGMSGKFNKVNKIGEPFLK